MPEDLVPEIELFLELVVSILLVQVRVLSQKEDGLGHESS